MDLAGYVALTRQSGLAKELQSVANNIANLSTTGYRREGLIFAEEVQALPVEGGSVAMTAARARYTDELQGSLQETGGTLDLAIEGEGYFTVMTPGGRAADPRRRLHPQRRRHRRQHGRPPAARRGRRRDRHPLRGEGDRRSRPTARSRSTARRWRGSASSTVEDQDQALPRGGRPLPRRRRRRVPVEDGRVVQGFLEQSNVSPVSRDGADGRGAARLRVRPEAPRPGGRAHPPGGAHPRPAGLSRTESGEYHACTEHRGDRHGGAEHAGRGDLAQPRQHDDHRLQRPARRVLRPALPAGRAARARSTPPTARCCRPACSSASACAPRRSRCRWRRAR